MALAVSPGCTVTRAAPSPSGALGPGGGALALSSASFRSRMDWPPAQRRDNNRSRVLAVTACVLRMRRKGRPLSRRASSMRRSSSCG